MKTALVLLFCAVTATAQRLSVKMIDQKLSESGYSYSVPGHFRTATTSDANCTAGLSSVSCTGNDRTQGTITAPRNVSYNVFGATLTLELPDKRLVVVNCSSKTKWWGEQRKRSCRIPFAPAFEAEFKGKDAKLFWPISVDGKKIESETYEIVAVLSPETSAQ